MKAIRNDYLEAGILSLLPHVRGRYSLNKDLSRLTWFRVGGPAHVLYKPADIEDLIFFLKHKPRHIPLYTLGMGSNILIRDGGLPGIVIRLGKKFANVSVCGTTINVGAGVLDRTLAQIVCEENLTGLEYLSSIPGTIGGALRMNAGCYGTEMKDILEVAFAIDTLGKMHVLTLEDMGFKYRHCDVPQEWIFVGARLKGKLGQAALIQEKMTSLLKEREKTQPVHSRTGGSTFANPETYKAWELIDQVGGRGLRRGGAQISQLHCNFMINTGEATAEDLESLGEEIRNRVRSHSGVDLQWEIKRMGIAKMEGMQKVEIA